MGTSGGDISYMEQEGDVHDVNVTLRDSRDAMVGSLRFHQDWAEDGSICAQLELRFEDLPSLVTIAEVGLEPQRHASRRTWVLVEVEQRQSFTEPLRFRINIPGKPGTTGPATGDAEAAAATIGPAREAISAVRKGCGNSSDCHYPVCDVAPFGSMRKLANDRCLSKLVPLEAQPLHAPDSGT